MTESVAAASACGKLIFSGGMPVASTAAPIQGVTPLGERGYETPGIRDDE